MEMTEHRLQYEIVKWYRHEFKSYSGALWANFSEQNKYQAGQKRAMGMIRALPDLMFVKQGKLIGIELKVPGKRHDSTHLKEQAEWLLKYPHIGWFCDSVDMAKDIIMNQGIGIDPIRVLDYLKKSNTKTISWKTELFL